MAKAITLSDFHRQQRGEIDASGDAEQRAVNAATVDPLTGSVVDADPFTIDPSAEDGEATARLKAIGAGPLAYDVAPDGTVADVRAAEMTPDAGPEAGTTVHQLGVDEQRFSGAGADDVPFGAASDLIPRDSDFNGRLYREAPELANIADQLIGEHGFLEDLQHCDIRWYWKRKTGVSKGRVKIGFMKRASDLLGHFSGADFIGWLSATTARDGRFTDEQVRAAVFHQLLHVGSDDKGNWIFVPHDFEGFAQEVRVFGTWTENLKLGGTAFVAAHQMGLFDSDDEEDEEGEEVGGSVWDEVRSDIEAETANDERGDVLAKYRTAAVEPADPDQPYDDEDLEDLPTGEEIGAARAKASSDLADLPFG